MRLLLLVLALTACGGGGDTSQIDAGGRVCAGPPKDLDPCSSTCGNGVIDKCFVTYNLGEVPCPEYDQVTEVCDGTQGRTCAESGYYAGTSGCRSYCAFDDTGCDSCATDARVQACQPWPSQVSTIAAVDPSTPGTPRLAFVDSYLRVVTFGAQGFQQVAQTALPGILRATTGARSGWLVATATYLADPSLALTRYDLDGTAGATATVQQNASKASIAYGPSDGALIAWVRSASPYELWFAIVDANTNIVVAPQLLASGPYTDVKTASDGTSYFVYTPAGVLYRIGSDGTVLSTVQGPTPSSDQFVGTYPIDMTFAGTTGWMLAWQNTSPSGVVAQRFDTSGALVGSSITITKPNADSFMSSFIEDAGELLYVSTTRVNEHVGASQLVRINVIGSQVSAVEFGRGAGGASIGRFAANIVVAWQGAGQKQQLALVTP